MATMEIINKAVKMINEHDFFWFYADYAAPARESSRGHMAAFVELVNSILNVDTKKALKDLWMARYEWAKKNMFEINKEALKVYEAIEAQTLAALATSTTYAMAA